MKTANPRISKKTEGQKEILFIKALYEKSKHNLLLAWIVLWSACGLYVVFEYFNTSEEQIKIVLLVWIAFWLYFEYKTIYAFRWRNSGMEEIAIEEDRISIARMINNRGIPRYYDIDYIKNVRLLKDNPRNFFQFMNNSYWIASGERLAFDFKGKTIGFGMELDEETSIQLCKYIRHEVEKRKDD